MQEIRKLFLDEHFKKIGFVDGFKYIFTKTGKIVSNITIEKFVSTGVLYV